MSEVRKFIVWLDSGANCESNMEQEVSLDELGVTSQEWDAMSEKERDDEMRNIAFQFADWGYREI